MYFPFSISIHSRFLYIRRSLYEVGILAYVVLCEPSFAMFLKFSSNLIDGIHFVIVAQDLATLTVSLAAFIKCLP